MANFRFHQISNTKKIRHISKIFKNSSFIVFLHGFMSDLEGKKPNAFLKFAKKNKISFLALEYSGHGKSSGKFTQGNITKWTNEVKISINKVVKKNKFILNKKKSYNLIKGYETKRSLTKNEKKAFNTLCKGSALRYLLTRAYDYLNTPKNAMIKKKNPREYIDKLYFHKNINKFSEYLR